MARNNMKAMRTKLILTIYSAGAEVANNVLEILNG